MKAISMLILGCGMLTGLSLGLGASPPPNDDFAHRIMLTGNSNTFTANLGEATTEPGELILSFPLKPTGTVWWSWTATDSSPITLQILALSGFIPIFQLR